MREVLVGIWDIFLGKLIVSFASNFQDTLEKLKSMGFFCKQLLISTKKPTAAVDELNNKYHDDGAHQHDIEL